MLAAQVWRNLLSSSDEKMRVAHDLGQTVGPCWDVSWQNDHLVVRWRLDGSADAGLEMSATAGSKVGSLTVVCDGTSIFANLEPEDESLKDDLAYAMAKVARQLDWSRVVLHGTALFRRMFCRHALHESDFYTWAFEMAHALRERQPAGIDWDGIAEELEDLGISQERAFESHMRVLLDHLLKWAYEPHRRSKSWKLSIDNNRDELKGLLDRNSGLRQRTPSLFNAAYRKARRDAAGETSFDEDAFPAKPPWSYEQVTDQTFWPGASTTTAT